MPPKRNNKKQSKKTKGGIGPESKNNKEAINVGPKSTDNAFWSWITGSRSSVYALKFEGEDEYKGCLFDGKFHGRGVFRSKDGEIYDGEWFQGQQHGKGKKTWPDGTQYEGEYKNDVREGQGVGVLPDGTRYAGEWKDGQWSGQGDLSWTNQSAKPNNIVKALKEGCILSDCVPIRYVGEFKSAVLDGRGKLEFESGDFYEGEFRNGFFEGFGRFQKKWKEYYEGQWVGGMLNGQGKHKTATEEYEGEFVNGRRTGRGELRMFRRGANGVLEPYGAWEGTFENGVRRGTGLHKPPDGSEPLVGEWWQHSVVRHPLPPETVVTVISEWQHADERQVKARKLMLQRAQKDMSAEDYEKFCRSMGLGPGGRGGPGAATVLPEPRRSMVSLHG